MRKTVIATAASALAALTMLAGVGVAQAEEKMPPITDDPAECIYIETYTGVVRGMCLNALTAGALGNLGYGSFGTGSLADLITQVINTGSVVLSVDVPNSTGSYAPGSVGSYGPEASVGQVAVGSIGSVGGSI